MTEHTVITCLNFAVHVIDHAMIMWESCTDYRTVHALIMYLLEMITWLSCTDQLADHALIM
ncbi:hypothetical protein ANAPC1_01490 [Anaplasma phagocytophilum]|uniref:Uncharacterized protein n=1 Tax=Anaplasma phagocytophilum TaxID=948 RepID=A0AA45UU97_ANAPH|nr:hypothetical protein ANAPC1_01490 [Anaplasma phagocytophilum]